MKVRSEAPECCNWKSPEVQRSHSKMSIILDNCAFFALLILYQSPKSYQLPDKPIRLLPHRLFVPHINPTHTTDVCVVVLSLAISLSLSRWATHSPSLRLYQHTWVTVTHMQTFLWCGLGKHNWSSHKKQHDVSIRMMFSQVQLSDTVIAVLAHHEIISTFPRKTKPANNLRLDKLHTYMKRLTGMSKNNFVASRKHMKKCQFWKMSSLKGKSKCQRDRYFTHRERCLLGVSQDGMRIIFFPCWNEPQLPDIKHTYKAVKSVT